jgi:peptidoglycan/LPS O-acetylase OafA/YrhL
MTSDQPQLAPLPGAGQKQAHIPALDGLRGAAVAAVLLFHDGRLHGGFLGVDLFFALSGYLITSLLINERALSGGIRFGKFWGRRFRRLLPAVLLLLACIVPLMYRFGTVAQLVSARHAVVPALLYVANWQQILHHVSYWDLFTQKSPLTHLWSLAVEEQFYVIWPVVVFAVCKLRHWRAALTTVTFVGLVGSFCLTLLLYVPGNTNRVYMGTDTRAASILAGALMAALPMVEWVKFVAHRRWWLVSALQLALAGALVYSWWAIKGDSSTLLYRGGLLAHSLAAALIAASIGLSRATPLQRLLCVRPLRWLGHISYGLYLWHWPIYIILTTERTHLHGWWLSLLRWAVSLAIAAASFFLLEAPIRYRRRLVTPSRVMLAGLVAVGLIVASVVATPHRAVAAASFDPGSITVPSTTVGAPTTSAVDATTTTVPRRHIHTLLFEGDSVGFDSEPGVLAALDAAGLAATGRTVLGGSLVDHDNVRLMPVFGDAIVAQKPDVVMYMISGWDAQFAHTRQQAAFDTYTALILAQGSALVFLTPPPVDTTKQHADISYMLGLAEALAKAHPDRVFVLDATSLWGPFKYDINGDGIPERKQDGVHVCPQGSALLGNWLAHRLAVLFDGVQPADPAGWAALPWVNDPRYSNPPGTCARH